MITTAPPQSALTREQIEAAIAALQPIHSIMIRLLLLQFLEPTLDDITFMARERSEPNNRAGGNLATTFGGNLAAAYRSNLGSPDKIEKSIALPKEWVSAVEHRVKQYQTQLREQRTRLDLQIAFLGDYLDGLRVELEAMEKLLTTECGTTQETLEDLHAQAKVAPVTYSLKKLAARTEKQEVEEEDYYRERLSLEYQAHIRRRDRFRKRLELVNLERQPFLMSSLSDEHLATIWGIARGTIMNRRVKAMQSFVNTLSTTLKVELDQNAFAAAVTAGLGKRTPGGNKSEGIGSVPLQISGDPWSRTLQTLAAIPVTPATPKPCDHDGGGKILAGRLRGIAEYVLVEDEEGKLWPRTAQCLSCLTRLRTIQQESGVLGQSADAVLARVRTRTAMPRKGAPETAALQTPAPPEEQGLDLAERLRPWIGEDRGDGAERVGGW
jgi:hypothetical protein